MDNYTRMALYGAKTQPLFFPLDEALIKDIEKLLAKHCREKIEEDDGDDVFIPAEVAFPELFSEKRYGVYLKGIRLRQNMTQKDLAEKLGVKQHHVSEMENGKRSIGKEMAKRLAKILNCNWRGLV